MKRLKIFFLGSLLCLWLWFGTNGEVYELVLTNAKTVKLIYDENTVFCDPKDDNGTPFLFDPRFVLDMKENVYCCDFNRKMIIKFNNNGHIIRFIGRPGQGPGEFQEPPSQFFISWGDYLYVKDANKLIKFNPDGQYLNNVRLTGLYTGEFLVSPDEHIFYLAKDFSNNSVANTMFVEFNQRIVKKLLSVLDTNARFVNAGVMVSHSTPYSSRLCMCLLPGGELCAGYNMEYKLYFYDSNGNQMHVSTVNIKRQRIEDDVIQLYQKKQVHGVKTVLPDYMPFFMKLLCDEKGRIYAVRPHSGLIKKKPVLVDIFDPRGHYCFQAEFPVLPEVIRNGSIYAFDNLEDENGDTIFRLKKWTIRNFDRLIPLKNE